MHDWSMDALIQIRWLLAEEEENLGLKKKKKTKFKVVPWINALMAD